MLRYFSQRNPTVLLPMAKVRVMVRVGVRVRVRDQAFRPYGQVYVLQGLQGVGEFAHVITPPRMKSQDQG